MRPYRNHIFDIVIASLALLLGVIMLPPFNIGAHVLNLLLALALAAYLVIHLFGKLQRSRGVTFILTLIEFSIICTVILGLVLQQLGVFKLVSVCTTLGFVLWIRGLASITVMYITLGRLKSTKYNLPKFLLYLALISVGVYLFAHPLISDLVFNWILCVVMLITSLIFTGLTILFWPAKSK